MALPMRRTIFLLTTFFLLVGGLFCVPFAGAQEITADFSVELSDTDQEARAIIHLENMHSEEREVQVVVVLSDKLFPHRNEAQERVLTLVPGDQQTIRMDFTYPWFGLAAFVPVISYEQNGITAHVRLDKITKFAVPLRGILLFLMVLLVINLLSLMVRVGRDWYQEKQKRVATTATASSEHTEAKPDSEEKKYLPQLGVRAWSGIFAVLLILGVGFWVNQLRLLGNTVQEQPQVDIVQEEQPTLPVIEEKPKEPEPEPPARNMLDITVYNGNGLRGVAGSFGSVLEENGFIEVERTNAERFDYEKTEIYYNNPAALSLVEEIGELAIQEGYTPQAIEDAEFSSSTIHIFLGEQTPSE